MACPRCLYCRGVLRSAASKKRGFCGFSLCKQAAARAGYDPEKGWPEVIQ